MKNGEACLGRWAIFMCLGWKNAIQNWIFFQFLRTIFMFVEVMFDCVMVLLVRVTLGNATRDG